MKLIFYWIKLVLFFVIIYSCNPVYYIPQSANIPLLTKKGDANIGVSSSLTSFGASTAYAFSDKVSGQINIAKTKYETSDDFLFSPSNYKINQLQLSAGLGFNKKFSSKFLFETYCIGYKGSFKNTREYTGAFAFNFEGSDNLPRGTLTYTELNGKYYVIKSQNSFAYTDGLFKLIGTLSLNGLKYYNVHGNLKYNDKNQADYIRQHSTYYFLEPSITARLSADNVHFQMQYLHSSCLTDNNFLSIKNVISVSLYKTFHLKRNKKMDVL